MDERRVHIYASGHGFVVVPVCQRTDKEWVECEPVQHISLEKALPIAALLGSAIDKSAQHPCDELHLWDGARGRWWAHHLYAARLTWQTESLQLAILPNRRRDGTGGLEPLSEPVKEWPANASSTHIARQLIALLGQALE